MYLIHVALGNFLANSFSNNSQGSASRVALNNVFHLTGNLLHSERKYLRPLTLPTSRSPETPICHLYERRRRRRRRRRHLLILSSVSHIPSSLNICKFRSPRCCSFLPSPSLPLLTSTSTVQSVPSVFITLLTQIKGVTGDVRNVAALPRLD